jgi:hypothetical protein
MFVVNLGSWLYVLVAPGIWSSCLDASLHFFDANSHTHQGFIMLSYESRFHQYNVAPLLLRFVVQCFLFCFQGAVACCTRALRLLALVASFTHSQDLRVICLLCLPHGRESRERRIMMHAPETFASSQGHSSFHNLRRGTPPMRRQKLSIDAECLLDFPYPAARGDMCTHSRGWSKSTHGSSMICSQVRTPCAVVTRRRCTVGRAIHAAVTSSCSASGGQVTGTAACTAAQ